MYKVKMDGRTLYYPGDKEAVLTAPTVKLQTGYAGTFEFTIPIINPLYDKIQNRRSMISVYRDTTEIFYGEVRKQPKIDRYKNKSVYCAGAMSFLSDSIQPQAEYHNMSSRQMLETFLNIHNSQVEDRKKIYIGIVTITNNGDLLYRYTNFENTFKAIREKLVDKLGGYLRLRHENEKLYLDWITLEQYGKYCEQPIEFGLNMLDYSESMTAENLVTALIPLGAQLQNESEIEALEKYVDITSVNGGTNYIYSQEAVETFGWIWTTTTWQDVTEPSNLLQKGKEWLEDNQFEELELTLTAVDLSALDKEYDSFDIGDRVHCRAKPYGMDRQFPVMEMTIPLQQPDNAKLTLGENRKISYTEQNKNNMQQVSQQIENTRKTTVWLQSAIDNATAMMTGSKGGYKVVEFDESGRWLRDLYLDAPDKEDATNVMQINMNGIGFSREGFDGPYKNAWTIAGQFLADFITAGSMQAERIRGGQLLSNNYVAGKSGMKIDLDKGSIDADRLSISDYLIYDPDRPVSSGETPMVIGGWQVRKTDYAEYWDTIETQENGIGAYGPWVIWGGWNRLDPFDPANYKFVVTEDGVCKAMEWLTGSKKELKEKLKKYDRSGLAEVLATDVYTYELKNQSSIWNNKGEHIGFVIGDGYKLSSDITDTKGSSIDMYRAIAVAYKAIQELAERIDKIKKKGK